MEKIKLTLALCGLTACFALFNPFDARGQQSKPAPTPVQDAPTSTPTPPNYEKFTHQSHLGVIKVPGTFQAHELKCDSCHDQRDLMKDLVMTTTRNKKELLKFPGHKACVECHITQFTALPQQTCTICHEVKQGLSARPPQRDFPYRYDFNAFFDAKQHEAHITYNLPSGARTDCNFCHQQLDKPALVGVGAHPACYVCHSPTSTDKKAASKSGCNVCHTEQTTNDPSVLQRQSKAYDAKFTHKTHIGYANGDCNACHTISGGYNQISPATLKITAHAVPDQRNGKGCFSCHDGGRHYGRIVFSGEPDNAGGSACSKCHSRNDYKVYARSGF